MPRFSFASYDRAGRMRRGDLEAASREAALAALAQQGQFAIELAAARAAGGEPWWRRDLLAGRRLALPVLAIFARELAILTKADLPLDEALRIVGLQPAVGARTRELTRTVLARVLEGASLSEALAAEQGAIPDYFWRIVRAGEIGGTLPQVLDELAAFLESSSRMRGEILSALLYPLVLLAAALVALSVIVTVMIPAIMPLFEDARVTPPLLLRALAGLEAGLVSGWPVLLALLGALVLGIVAASRSEPVLVLRDRALLSIPVLGGLIERRSTAQLARTLATLIRNGVPMLDALDVCAGVLANRCYRAAIRQAERELNEGKSIAAPLQRSGLFPEVALRLIQVGEQSGQLEIMLVRVAEIFEHDVRTRLQRLIGLMAPILTLAIGALVGGLILSVMGAILSINDLALK